MRMGGHLLLTALAASMAVCGGCGGGFDEFAERYIDLRVSQSAPTVHRQGSRPGGLWLAEGGGSDPAVIRTDLPVGPGDEQPPADAPAADPQPEHWKTRRGPAYKNNWLHSFGRDGKEMAFTMWDDAKHTFTDPWALAGLAAAGAVGIAVNGADCDNTVADHYKRHGSRLDKCMDNVGDVGGNPGLHFGVAGAMYFASLAADDVKTYETSKTLINALAINGLTTLALKGIVRTRSPNGDPMGWPSGHTSSTFCLATVLYEAYGPLVGVPLFAFAGFVGYERIDARNHDFSDVLSGALIGIAIGHAVMQNHKPRVLGFEVLPWADPSGNAVGLALTKRF